LVDGDADNDQDVDGDDLAIWRGQFGGPAPLSTVHAIPEPTALQIVVLVLSTAIFVRVR